MRQNEYLASLVKEYQYGINTLPYVIDYLRIRFSQLQIKSVIPDAFTIGSNNHSEGLSYDFESKNSLYFGNLYISINPNDGILQDEKIELRYRSYFNKVPFWKTITRQVEIENLVNESSTSTELFDRIELSQLSDKYDLYVTFVGFKIDLI